MFLKMLLAQILQYGTLEKRKQRIINHNHSSNLNEYYLFNYIYEHLYKCKTIHHLDSY